MNEKFCEKCGKIVPVKETKTSPTHHGTLYETTCVPAGHWVSTRIDKRETI